MNEIEVESSLTQSWKLYVYETLDNAMHRNWTTFTQAMWENMFPALYLERQGQQFKRKKQQLEMYKDAPTSLFE